MARTALLFLASLAALAHAQPGGVQFERATGVEPSLPQSSVYEILEDRRGFLWFATREGLGRWDGHTMRTWRRRPFDEASLPGNVVRQLVLDGRGDLWVSTEATDWSPTGSARLVGPAHDEVHRYGHPGTRLFVGPDGRAWLADSLDLWRFDAEADGFVRDRERIERGPVAAGLATRDGTLWLATQEGIEAYPPDGPPRLVRPDRPWHEGEGLSSSRFNALAEGPDDVVWGGGALLGRLDAARGRSETLGVPAPTLAGHGVGLSVNESLPDAGGAWAATLDGVYRIDADGYTRHSLRLPGDVDTQNWVAGLHRDRTGAVWAGTVWGLHRAAPSGPPFRLIAHDPDDPNSLGCGIVLAVHRGPRGALWVGTLGGGLNRIGLDGAVTRLRHARADARTISHDWIWSIRSDADRVWVGTGGGLDAVDPDPPHAVRRYRFEADPATGAGPSATGLHVGSDGTLWFGHIGGLNRLLPDGTRRTTMTPNGAGVQAIVEAPGGAWVASGGGLLRYDAGADALRVIRHDPDDPASLSDDATIALHRDRRGRLWVGTQSGLDRFDPATGGFEHVTSADGLPSDVVYAILEDDAGRLWISTNRGLARYDEAATPRVRAFSLADGVGNVEFNRNAAFRDADGTMYFGGDRGVTVFHPDAFATASPAPPVVVTAVERATREGTARSDYVGPEGVVLAPDVTTFALEFAALEFVHAHRSRYAVRLDGWDEDWVEVGDRRLVSYTNLPPGRYAFRVRATDADGAWGPEADSVPILVQPALWETWGFRTLLALALVGLVAGVGWGVSRRRYQRELAELKAQQARDAERARISRDVHDEVGASLSEIAILSEVARRQLDGEANEERLRRIAETSREMLDSLGQIVWAVNPRNDRLPALAGYLREHAARFLDAHGLRARLDVARLGDAPVPAEVRRAVFLVLKEALHNVVKHAGAAEVAVTFGAEGDRLVLTVRDDGRGLAGGDGVRWAGGDGLGNMARRAEEVGGSLAVCDAVGGGTEVRLDVPVAGATSPVDVTRREAARA